MANGDISTLGLRGGPCQCPLFGAVPRAWFSGALLGSDGVEQRPTLFDVIAARNADLPCQSLLEALDSKETGGRNHSERAAVAAVAFGQVVELARAAV